jgi:Uma2 family endonuclease
MPNVAVADNSPDIIPEWIRPRRNLDGFCWNDYVKWGEDVRVEMIDGLVYMMGSPDEWHQWVVGNMYSQLSDFLNGKKCTPYIAPFDVRLFSQEDGSDNTVFQPDVFVVCDKDKVFGKKSCNGAPDFVIEVMSDSSRGRDLEDKKIWYYKAGVKEYWVVSADRLYVYRPGVNGYDETAREMSGLSEMPVGVLPGCVIKFDDMKKRYA